MFATWLKKYATRKIELLRIFILLR